MTTRIQWTPGEVLKVAKVFGETYKAEDTSIANLKTSLQHAQFVLPEGRRKSLEAASVVYKLRAQLLAVYNAEKEKDEAFKAKAQELVDSVSKPNLPVPPLTPENFLPILEAQKAPWKEIPETKPRRFQAIMPLPEVKPAPELPGSPVGRIVAHVIELELKKAVPEIVEALRVQFQVQLNQGLHNLREEMKAEVELQLARQKADLIAYWEGGANGVAQVDEAAAAMVTTPMVDPEPLGFKDVSAATTPAVKCNVSKKKMLIFGALDNQRTAYQQAFPDWTVDVSKDAKKAGRVMGYDLVVVLDDFVRSDTRRVFVKNNDASRIKFMKGTVSRVKEQILALVHTH